MRNWEKRPELRNSELALHYFESPHKQIFNDFEAKVEKVVDGDTIEVSCDFRDFNFKIRSLGIDAPELNEPGGKEAKEFLKERIEGEEVKILIDKDNRVGKWGRLMGKIQSDGEILEETLLRIGMATTFENRNEGEIPKIDAELNIKQWIK